jgi:hypothetical protein
MAAQFHRPFLQCWVGWAGSGSEWGGGVHMKAVQFLPILFAALFAACNMFAGSAFAHPGGLNKEGCHNNRKTGEYHCHRGSGKPQQLSSKPKKKKVACEEFPRCQGCGCKGGPGYRSRQTSKCVGYKQLKAECGTPPSSACNFENAPGTGANRQCVLGQ